MLPLLATALVLGVGSLDALGGFRIAPGSPDEPPPGCIPLLGLDRVGPVLFLLVPALVALLPLATLLLTLLALLFLLFVAGLLVIAGLAVTRLTPLLPTLLAGLSAISVLLLASPAASLSDLLLPDLLLGRAYADITLALLSTTTATLLTRSTA